MWIHLNGGLHVTGLMLDMSGGYLYISQYIYVYVYVCICVCIYIYIYMNDLTIWPMDELIITEIPYMGEW